MSGTIFNDMWMEYLKTAVPVDATPRQIAVVKNNFYYGADAIKLVLSSIKKAAKERPGAHNRIAAEQILFSIMQEISVYIKASRKLG